MSILGASSRGATPVALSFQLAPNECLLEAVQRELTQAQCAPRGHLYFMQKPLRPGVTLAMLGVSSEEVVIRLQPAGGLLGGSWVSACVPLHDPTCCCILAVPVPVPVLEPELEPVPEP